MGASLEGIGIGLRGEYIEQLLETKRTVDWLEIIPENWTRVGGRSPQLLRQCMERWPLIPHSTALSIGGPEPFDLDYLASMREICALIRPPFFSDHVCYSYINGAHTHELLPLPASEEAIEHVLRRIKEVQPQLEVPLVLENPSYYAVMPGSTMDESVFVASIIEQAQIGMLLDVNNVYVNSKNHGFDPRAYIDRMPLDRVRQIHMAGHSLHGAIIIDTHKGPVIDEVWDLYRYTIARAGRLIPTLIEWDQDIPPIDQVLDEVDRARNEAAKALAGADLSAAHG